jgi:hypothetical protein
VQDLIDLVWHRSDYGRRYHPPVDATTLARWLEAAGASVRARGDDLDPAAGAADALARAARAARDTLTEDFVGFEAVDAAARTAEAAARLSALESGREDPGARLVALLLAALVQALQESGSTGPAEAP